MSLYVLDANLGKTRPWPGLLHTRPVTPGQALPLHGLHLKNVNLPLPILPLPNLGRANPTNAGEGTRQPKGGKRDMDAHANPRRGAPVLYLGGSRGRRGEAGVKYSVWAWLSKPSRLCPRILQLSETQNCHMTRQLRPRSTPKRNENVFKYLSSSAHSSTGHSPNAHHQMNGGCYSAVRRNEGLTHTTVG